MRLTSLELELYGPFRDRRIAFRQDARLHVVYGRNEAGKSRALAAVADLLFGGQQGKGRQKGKPSQPAEEFRLRAEIEARDGRALGFQRRNGRRNTLSDLGGKTLPDDALAPYLGGLTRSVFANAFGLDAVSLREGALDMLRNEGEIGSTLLGAASGLRNIRDVARTLNEEADGLFTPASRTRHLNELVKRYEEASQAARATRLGQEGWRAIETGLAQASYRLDEITARRREIATESSRLRRLKGVAPILLLLDEQGGELEAFADLPDLPRKMVVELADALSALGKSRERLSSAEAALARAEAGLVEIAQDETIAPWTTAIEALGPRSGAYRKAADDLPRVEGEAEHVERALAALATRLGFATAQDMQRRLPSDASQADLRRLLQEGRDIEFTRSDRLHELERLRGDLTALRKASENRAPLPDVPALRLAHEALRPVLDEIGRRDALLEEVGRASAALAKAASRLRPPLDLSAGTVLPSPETISRHAEALAKTTRQGEQVRDRIEAWEKDLAKVTARMRARLDDGDIPDRQELLRRRGERDVAWAAVRDTALGVETAPRGERLIQAVGAFERANAEADRLADGLVRDARRVAEQSTDARNRDELKWEIEQASAQSERVDQALSLAGRQWRELWSAVTPSPFGPAEMTEWHGRAAAILDQAGELALRRADAQDLVQKIESIRPQIEALATRLRLDLLRGLEIGLLNGRVIERLQAHGEAWEGARDAEIRVASTREAVEDAEAALADAERRRDDWARAWRAALAICSLGEATGFEGAETALRAWGQVPGLIEQRDDKLHRVAGMRRDISAYEAEVRRLAQQVGIAADGEASSVSARLTERLRTAREAKAAHAAALRLRDEAGEAHDRASDAERRTLSGLSDLTRRLGRAEIDDLPGFVRRLEARARLNERTQTLRDELARAGDGVPETELRAGLAGLHVDEIEGRLSEFSLEEDRLEEEGRIAHSQRDRLKEQRDGLETGLGAEIATARKGAAEIEIRETARRYLRLKLGSLLLDGAIERHRASRQAPLVARAASLFSGLTGGLYGGLEAAFDGDEQPTLAGRRANDGRRVPIARMSEGTADQLFLALRLAYLEDYAGRAEPAPFLGDDIFASFDDRRTEYGLSALAAIGERVQPILFTHHETVARAAERTLGGDVDVIELA